VDQTLKQRIDHDMKDAMRAREKERLGAIRLLLAAIKQVEIDQRIELDDTAVLAVIDKMAKQNKNIGWRLIAIGRRVKKLEAMWIEEEKQFDL